MKDLKELLENIKTLDIKISEKLKIDSSSNISSGYVPKDKEELKKLVKQRCKDKNGDFTDIDVSNMENLSHIFYYCDLSEIDITGWKTSKCTNMKAMFAESIYLEKIIGIDDLDISNVDELSFIFSGCRNLKNVGDLGKWDVKDKELHYAFQDCVKLKYIGNVKNWKLKNPHWSVFSNCDIPLKDLPSKKP